MNNVTIKQLKAFTTIATLNSYAEAGLHLHLSQPALSIAIKNLEQAIGGKLLERTTRNITLTPEGTQFLPTAQRLLSHWENAFDELHELFTLQRGKLAIAAMPSFASTSLPKHIKTFKNQYPEIEIKLHDVIAEDAIEIIRQGRAELAFSFDPGACDDLVFEPLFTDHFIAALPKGSPLVSKREVSWQMLSTHEFIALQRPSTIRLLIEERLQAQQQSLNITYETNQLATIGQMVSTGLGVSAMPSLYREQLVAQGVVCRALIAPRVSRRVGIVYRKKHSLSTVASAFMVQLKQSYQDEK